MTTVPWISAAEVFASLSFAEATRAISDALTGGLDPRADFPRGILPLTRGQLLLMPSESDRFVGVKITTVAPENPSVGKERIQGVYVLMDAGTLSPLAILDGTALTTLRTPAVSAAAATLLAPRVVEHLVVFGSGPQARAHIDVLRTFWKLSRVTVVGRNREHSETLVRSLTESGLASRRGAAEDVGDAQIIICATTSRTPVFDGTLVPEDSVTIAVGSHEAAARELDSRLIGRAQVVVEDVEVALREGGDVVIPIREGRLDPSSLFSLRDVITGAIMIDRTRPRVFTSSGMSWEDLVVAAKVYLHHVEQFSENLKS